eukprot:767320-Hanusia_phi.AAC.2
MNEGLDGVDLEDDDIEEEGDGDDDDYDYDDDGSRDDDVGGDCTAAAAHEDYVGSFGVVWRRSMRGRLSWRADRIL